MDARTTPLRLRTFDIARRSSADMSIHLYPEGNDEYPEYPEWDEYPERDGDRSGLHVVVYLIVCLQ